MPDGGVHTTDLIPDPSVAGASNVTTALGELLDVAAVMYLPTAHVGEAVPGHVMVGLVVSTTNILIVHDVVRPALSVAVQTTTELPNGKGVVLEALQTVDPIPELSLAVN